MIGRGLLVAIEGVDASGKHTQAQMLKKRADENGFKSATMSFPRYGKTLFSESVADYLNGELLDDASPYFAALLFAGDRFESLQLLMRLINSHDLVILDRYVSSNLAYQAARIDDEKRANFINWLSRIEYEIYNLPKADLTIWMKVPLRIVSTLISQRGYSDIHERELPYLNACHKIYKMLCATNHCSTWHVVNCLDSNKELCIPLEINDKLWGIVLGELCRKE